MECNGRKCSVADCVGLLCVVGVYRQRLIAVGTPVCGIAVPLCTHFCCEEQLTRGGLLWSQQDVYCLGDQEARGAFS